MIQEVNFGGKMIKCEVKVDKKIIALITIPLFLGPIYFIFLKEYFIAGLVHLLTLGGICLGGRSFFMDYIPIKDKSTQT